MVGTKLVTTAVLLLLFWSTHQVNAQDPLTVSITVDRTDPPGFTPENLTDYRAASGPQVVTCTATGGSGSGDYDYKWTSTCSRGCAFKNKTKSVISRTAVHSGDVGTHTCTATRDGETAMDSVVFNIVGAGIHIFVGVLPRGSQPNNGLVRPSDTTSTDPKKYCLRFFCRSNSTMKNVGELIGPGGTSITSNDIFEIGTGRIGGELQVAILVGSNDVTSSEQGVYTCRIPLQSEEIREINIGIYPNAFNSVPSITNPLVFTHGSPSSTLTCTSTTSIAITVTFMRDGNAINGLVRDGDSAIVNGVTYQLSQTLTNRTQSTYDNVLTITEPLSSLAGSNFTCQVENVLGASQTSQSFQILDVEISVSYTPPPGFTPGPNEYRAASGPVVVTCTATGGSGSGDYEYVWTSTCSRRCDFQTMSTGVTSVISRTAIHSGDVGTHTCTASKGGDSASDSIVFNVVGAGIHVFNGANRGSQPNNGLVVSANPGSKHRFRFFCRSDSLILNVGGLIGPDGNNFSGNAYLVFETPTKGGELRIVNTKGSEDLLPASEQGIYTCQIPLQSGVMVMINIGVYPIGFNSKPTINDPLVFTPGSPSTVTCISTDSPATTVTFMRGSTTVGPLRDGESVSVGGVTYVLAQRVINRRESTYENILTVNDTLANLVGDTFTCTVTNTLGMDTSQPITISVPLELSAVSSTTRLPDVTPYNNFNLTCTATAPEGVVAHKNFIWRKADPADDTCNDFTKVDGNMDSNLEQPVSTSVLNVTVSETDIGVLRFCCQASIAGVSGTSNNVLSIDVVGPASPMQPTDLRVISTDATTATVQWTVPLIAYTPETYVVSYSTGSLTRQVLMSDPVESGADFDAVNQTFSVELTRLTPNITFNYQVISSNIIGTNTSETKTLTTTPGGGGGGGSNGGAIAGGIIGAIIAIVLIVLIIILVTWLYRFDTATFVLQHSMSRSNPWQREKGEKSYVPAPLVRENINSTTGQELESLHYTRATEKVTAAKNVAPIIHEFPENDVTFLEGEGLSFAIQVAGILTPSTVWYQDGKELVSDYSLEIAGDGSLTIHSVEPRHSGSYKLVVTNQAGSMERTVKVMVLPEAEATPSTPRRQQVDETPIPVAEFGKYVANNHSNNNRGFQELYDALYSGGDRPVVNAKSAKDMPFNRFANITVYDDNRISLQPLPGHSDCQREYINASYVDGYSIPKKYIATQGPLPKTNVDFWRLVWQERPPSIVMVTNLQEGNKMKCQQYWPESGSKKFGPFKITITHQQTYADYIIRTFSVQLTGSSERSLKVTQFHFTAWPDHGVPDYATPMLTFHRRVISQHVPSRGPLVVHCSAGVGRTGTFITIDCVLEQLQKEQVIDIFGIINSIRKQRMSMVQNVKQFSFVHDAVLESVTCGDTQIAATNFRLAIRDLERKDPQTHQSGFESQFQVLHQVSPKPDEVCRDAGIRYCDMNRSVNYLPPDQYRVVLKGEVPDYIHAVSANGYKQQKAFIITENPTERTSRNFWKMLYSRNCAAIVMLSQLVENGQEVCYQYWPTSGVKQIGEFIVDLLGEEKLEGFVLRTLSMLDTTFGKAQQITQFHIVNWAPNGHCSNLKTITDIIEEVGKVQRKTGNHPIAIHCSDTVCRSGMFCSIATTIERCKTEGVVDVFQVVKALRVQKPGAILTVAQYQHVFEAVLVFLDSFDTYTNFQNI